MPQRWLVGGTAGLRSWRFDRPGLTIGWASLIPVHFKSKHSSLYSTSSIHKHFPTGEGRSHNERPFCQCFCGRYADRKWKGLCSRKKLLEHPPFSSSLSLCLTKVNLNKCVCAHFWHSFNVYWHRCMQQLDHHFDDARSGSWAKWEETRWKESGGTRKGECFTCTIWSHWSTHGWVSYLNGKAWAVRALSQFCRCDFRCLPLNIRRLRSIFSLGGGSGLCVWRLPTAVQFPGFIHGWAWLTCFVRKVIRQRWNGSQITAHGIRFFTQGVSNYGTQPFFFLQILKCSIIY